MKKKLLLIFLFVNMMVILLSCKSFACDYCDTDPEVIDELHSALLNRKMLNNTADNDISLMSAIDPAAVMPSTGDVKILVLPIEFADYKISDEEYSELENHFFGEYDDSLDDVTEQSVAAQYEIYSYGKLRISGDVLPVYTINKNRADFRNVTNYIGEAISEALASYGFLHNNLSQYDSDGDGYLDGLYIKYAGPVEAVYNGSYWVRAAGLAGVDNIELPDDKIKLGYFAREPAKDDCSVTAHEVGHLLGLDDHYLPGRPPLNQYHGDLMAFREGNINAYYKYLLDWVSEDDGSLVVLTNDDVITDEKQNEIELFASDNGGDAKDKPKAVILVPDKLLLPSTEFYIAEYREGGKNCTMPLSRLQSPDY